MVPLLHLNMADHYLDAIQLTIGPEKDGCRSQKCAVH